MIKNYTLETNSKIFWPTRQTFEFNLLAKLNILARHHAPVIANPSGSPCADIDLMAWGVNVPGERMPHLTIKREALSGRLADATENCRCLVPASRFELSHCDGEEGIWEFSQKNHAPFCFAGFFLRETHLRRGLTAFKAALPAIHASFAIITIQREAFPEGPVISMPLVLEPRAYNAWFETGELPEYQNSALRCESMVCV